MHKYPELHEALSSPIPSLRTPFTRAGDIDFDGLRGYVDRCISNGAKALMLTMGDSLYSLLTDEDVVQVTQTVVAQAAGRANVIAADRTWWTGKAVEFARYCRQLDVDVLMVLPPDWAGAATEQTLVEHYAAVAAEIPVMMVTGVFRERGQAFGLTVIEQVYEKVDNVVAIKDDFAEEFARRMTVLVHERWTVVAGGTKQLHFYMWPFGCHGLLSTLIHFQPEIAHRYFAATQAGDYITAAGIVRKIDMPMFKLLAASPGGFDAAMHAWAELCGIYGRWRRPPFYNMTDAEVEHLAEGLRKLDLL
jgi:dihydrodipicolinate synthase/N-acetylneuraminate lyase